MGFLKIIFILNKVVFEKISLFLYRKITSKYDYITSKVLIASGPPTVYQLGAKRETAGSLRRMTFGKKDPGKENKTILLVGETGTGKSTLINALINYAMGVEWEDNVWFKFVEDLEGEEDKERNQSESQTSDVIVYQIFGFEGKTLPYSLTIIDTPGYGDTRGTEKDDIVKLRLLDLFRSEDGVHEISAVALVLKASENRVSDRLRYIFDSVVSLFGKDMEKNFVAFITHSDGLPPDNVLQALEDANIRFAKDEDNDPVYFMFNNRQATQKTKKTMFALKSAWDLTKDQIKQLADFMEKESPQNLNKTVEVLKSRTRLTACIQSLQERIGLTEMKQKEIQQTQEALKKYEEEMKNNENFTIEVDEPYKDKEEIKGGWWFWGWSNWQFTKLFYEGAVCCTVCEENCHYPGCTVAAVPSRCELMKDGKCTSCTGKCPVSAHVKEEWIYVNKTRKVHKTQQEMKEKYEKNKAKNDTKQNLLETLKKNNQELQNEKEQLLEESFLHVVRLEEIALSDNSLSTLVHLDFLIKKMKEKGDVEDKVKILEEIKGRMANDGKFMGALRYGYNKVKAARKALGQLTKDLSFSND